LTLEGYIERFRSEVALFVEEANEIRNLVHSWWESDQGSV